MGCCFSRRGKPAEGGQQPAAAGTAGQDAAAGGEKVPKYSWDQRAKVLLQQLSPPVTGSRLTGLGGSTGCSGGQRLALFCRLECAGLWPWQGPYVGRLPFALGVGGVCAQFGSSVTPLRCYGSVHAVKCVCFKIKVSVFPRDFARRSQVVQT